MKKIVLTVIDGLGDRPVSSLGGKTPLEAAATPNLDKWAEQGVCGLVEVFQFPFEKKPTSEGTHIALLGLKESFLGRGPYEAAGCGMELEEGDLAFRANFATVDRDLVIKDRRAGRIKGKKPLVEALSGIEIDGVQFLIKDSLSHRAALVMRGKELSDKVEKNDPKKPGVKVKEVNPTSKEGEFTAQVLNKFIEKAHQILKEHSFNKERELPANYLLVRGAGVYKKTRGFEEKYGIKGCCVAGGGLYKGVARLAGMDLVEPKGATAGIDTNIKSKFNSVNECLKTYDFVFCHIKATDILGHDGDCEGKRDFIEKIDKELPVLSQDKNIVWAVTADHSTPCEVKDHSKDPTPLLVYGSIADEIESFSGKECAKGAIGVLPQEKVMDKIMQLAKEK